MKFSFGLGNDFTESIRSLYSLKRVIIFLFDNLLGLITLFLAFLLRYDWEIPPHELRHYFNLAPVVFICRSISYLYYRFYTRLWEYSSLEDLIQIIKAVLVGSFLILFTIFIINRAIIIPRSIMVIDIVLLITMLGGSRMAWRLWNEQAAKRTGGDQEGGIKVLILGAGVTGALLIKNLRIMSPHYSVCGFIDDDPKKLSTILMGVKVLGNRHKIPELVKKLGVKEILIALNKISSDSLSEIVDICNKSVVKYKMAASVIDLATNEVHISKVKKIEISDLLGRDPVSLDITAIKKMIYQKRVLVTGAGGSIGSELCQQILEYEPATLTMLDRGENYLYELGMTLNPQKKNTNTQYLFGSITNKEKMNSIFSQCRPQLVFHAAAHKHVPLMEENVDEAVINNVYGTKITADTSDKFGVERFVMVSTDKVVKPVSVMGMTKRIAEQYIQYIDGKSQTKFMTVRFGNVLGSKGSVIPLFQKQIESGGPVTVTDPEMTRYFMLIPEAVHLILQAAVIGNGGEIFLLNMGEPVRIADLARKMISLAGYEPDKDIEIKYVGIRPGEKMHEELYGGGDQVVQTFHKKIRMLKSTRMGLEDYNLRIGELFKAAVRGNFNEIKELMNELIATKYSTESIASKKDSFAESK